MTSLTRALLQSGAVLLLYIGLSLLDVWGYLPPLVHLAVCGLTIGLAVSAFSLSLKSRRAPSLFPMMRNFGLCALLVGLLALVAGDDLDRRWTLAIHPAALFDYPVARVQARVIPPAYTGAPVLDHEFIADGGRSVGADLNPIPSGSRLKVRLENSPWPAVLKAGRREVRLEETSPGVYEGELVIEQATNWQVRRGSEKLGSWPIILLQDQAPEIQQFDMAEELTSLGLASFTLNVADDYGLSRVRIRVTQPDRPEAEPYEKDLPLEELRTYDGQFYVDLSMSNAAGGPATLSLIAEDQAGQASQKDISGVHIPRRQFADAMAGKFASLREELLQHPENRQSVARQLMALSLLPGEDSDSPVYHLALRSAYWRLVSPSDPGDPEEARRILWDLANLAESGAHGQLELALVEKLDDIRLLLLQGKPAERVRQELGLLDDLFAQLAGKQKKTLLSSDEILDHRVLHKLYGRVLYYADKRHHDKAERLMDYLRTALVNQDVSFLTIGGYSRFVAATQGQQIMDNLITIQKRLLANSYKGGLKAEIVTTDKTGHYEARVRREWQEWSQTQSRIGDSLDQLSSALIGSGIDSRDDVEEVHRLIRDVLASLEAGQMETAAQYQSQILVLLNNLKHRLGEELSHGTLMRALEEKESGS
ncbi:DUF4175 family protein [Emcibacter nanhaiensis]|uniref:DUF4175 domain-containing protein n=1 Tax=Emcibacter nanhaiensis TaxID=1505037 RepID=A0A501PPD5_9PROT|nr:DUF4175 family protein [Emcibacter nanhaiensis]TPD61656.1 DUF4175 domain-containing protein [Emcibacter nanhaiensis]